VGGRTAADGLDGGGAGGAAAARRGGGGGRRAAPAPPGGGGRARRYLHVYGPTTPQAFARWAGIGPRYAVAMFDALRPSLTPVRTPIGAAWILSRDEPTLRAAPGSAAPARLLPSGDAFFLLHGADRELLVPDARRRAVLWPPRVWPGALLVDGDIAGTWRRSNETITIETWRRLPRTARDAVEAEARSLPIPVERRVVVRWNE
jgi:hypothetical protein